jgi:cytochrome c551/c552
MENNIIKSKSQAVEIPAGAETEAIKQVSKIIQGIVSATKEYNMKKQEEITERKRINAQKEVAIKLIDSQREVIMKQLSINERNSDTIIKSLCGLLTTDIAKESPELVKVIVEKLVGIALESIQMPNINIISLSTNKLLQL